MAKLEHSRDCAFDEVGACQCDYWSRWATRTSERLRRAIKRAAKEQKFPELLSRRVGRILLHAEKLQWLETGCIKVKRPMFGK